MKFHRILNVTQISAWYMLHNVREAFAHEGGLFYGESKVDETFARVLELNKHESKKQEQGRSATGKTVVVRAKEHNGKKVKAQVISDCGRESLHGFLAENVETGTLMNNSKHIVSWPATVTCLSSMLQESM